MKKFYSLVLMTAALLIGTNAWAKDFSGNAAQLQKAIADIIYGAVSDPEIKLQNDVELNGTIWVGTEKLSDPYKSITLDLNGHSITYNSADPKNNRTLIALTHGELKIINTAANEATLGLTGNAADGATIVSVYGSYRSSRWNEAGTELTGEGTNTRVEGWCSHLEIGSNVKLYAEQGCQGTGLYIGTGTLKYPKADGTLANTAYPVSVMNTSGWGFAHGVRVDFYGKIDFQGTNEGKGYGIKANGTMRSPLSCANDTKEGFNTNYTTSTKTTTYIPYLANYYNNNADINKNATLATDATHKRDTVDAPFIWIHPGAEVIVRDAGSKVTALYAAGYAKWLVQGYAAGKTGMYVSSGVMDLNDAYVKSTAAGWESSTSAGSANGGGSGVVINSRDSYAGGVEFAVTGDTHIESIKGYAIEEIVNTTAEPNPDFDPTQPVGPENPETIQVTKVADITIEGGTISGGDEGAIVVSTATLEEAAKNEDVEVVIYGGNVIGDSYAGDKGAVTTGDLNDLMPKTGDYHTTEVTDEKGNTIIVVSKGGDPDSHETVHGQTGSVNWEWSTASTEAMKDSVAVETMPAGKTVLMLDELEINQDYDQTLIVKDGYTLTVGRVVMGTKAKIIVEAGGKFIVNGAQGIVAPIADNIVIKTQEGHPAYFLFNPAVTSNRHPNATVDFISKSYRVSSENYAWQRFGIPTHSALTEVTAKKGEENIGTAFASFDFASNSWVRFGYINTPGYSMDYSKMANAFDYYQLLNNTPTAGTVVTMKGELFGNSNPNLEVRGNSWNGYANSYMAPINCEEFINMIPASVQGAFYLYNIHEEGWTDWDPVTLAFAEDIQPLQPFLVRNANAATQLDINYADAVYYPTTGETKPSNAPARLKAVKNITKAKIIVKGEECIDRVGVAEDAQFSAEFDNGYDAVKFMNEGVNMYVNADEKMAIFATDDVENTYVGFQTIKGGTYTIEFANVQGEELILIDLETGARVAMVEGNVYEFTAAANSVNDYRFQITKINKVATDIENTEAVKSVKGIYTITGQYVGEMNVWNTLPAGVYVVNGEKRVK